MRKKSVGHAFSDHIFEERIKKRKNGSGFRGRGLFRFLPLVILFAVFILLSLRLFTLQIVRAEYYSRLSDENRIRRYLVPAPRGIIFDRNEKALVRNIPAYSILENGKVKWLSNDDALKRLAKGEAVLLTVKRDYLYKDTFAHVLGYIGQVNETEVLRPEFKNYGLSDFTGRQGLEQQYERVLHGENGKLLYEVNARGEIIRLLGSQDPRGGAIINTTLDVDIQEAASEAMSDIERGAVIVSDPRDGSILALYSKPSFDPNLFTRESSYEPSGGYENQEDILLDDKEFPLLNRAISGVYPPGSTYKLLTSIAGLETKAVNEDTEIEDTGTITVGGSTFGTWNFLENGRKEGFMDIVAALKRSNDIYFYQIGMDIGVDDLSKWSRDVGFGKTTGIDLPGEVEGTVPSPSWKEETLDEQWYLGDTINMSIGQGYLETTPLQINVLTQLVANGGQLFKPHILKNDVRLVKKDFILKQNLELIGTGMKEACEQGGTGYPMFDFKVKNQNMIVDDLDYLKTASAGADMVNVTMGCKTGTSESHGYEAKSHAWFTVFAPYYNPEIVITVLAENAGQGSDVAAPIAKEIMTKYFESKKSN